MSQIITKRVTNSKEKCIAPDGYIPVPVVSWHKKDSEYYSLSPFYLRTDGNEEQVNNGNVIFENFWQGSKVYPEVNKIDHYTNSTLRGNPKYLLWKYDRNEKHINNNNITPEYFIWRKSLFECDNAIRYPLGFNNRKTVKFSLLNKKDGTSEKLDYLSSRKRIYCKEYKRLVRKTDQYKKILNLLLQNNKICIFDIDVPDKNKKGLYGEYSNNNIFEVTYEKLEKLLNDPSEPFGHGLALAMALLEDINIKKLELLQKEINNLDKLLCDKHKEYIDLCNKIFYN